MLLHKYLRLQILGLGRASTLQLCAKGEGMVYTESKERMDCP
jgi:hypothetical protein